MSLPWSVELPGGASLLLMMPHADDRNHSLLLQGEQMEAQPSGARMIKTSASLPSGRRSFDFLCSSLEEIAFLEEFFDACKGRYKGFWMPTWQWELEPAPHYEYDAYISWMHMYPRNMPEAYALGNLNWRRLMFVYGAALAVFDVIDILADHPVGTGYERLTLQGVHSIGSIPVPLPWTFGTGVRPFWLRYVRFDSDQLDTKEMGDGQAMISTTVMEIPQEAT